MGIIHFLNVREGDCSIIQHLSGNITVIDISNGDSIMNLNESAYGNHQQKNFPVNPIEYLDNLDVSTIFRFILTHPDMDHMDGIKELFNSFKVLNFWDTKNNKIIDNNSSWGKYKKEDWDFYQKIRTSKKCPKVLNLYANAKGKYYNLDENDKKGADGLYILAPTVELVDKANKSKDYNDCSYVILYRTRNRRKVVFAGDSAKLTWDYILNYHKQEVSDVDLLIAPHHGRKSGGNDDYLDVLNPKLTLFGNAKCDNLDYSSWNSRGLDHITNNQANCIIIDTDGYDGIRVYVTYKIYAEKINPKTEYSTEHKGWYIKTI